MAQKTNRLYKSRLFVMIFEEKKKLLELYNAVSGKHYEDPELLEINTLDNAIYMSMKNDLSFLLDARLSLYEQKSSASNTSFCCFLQWGKETARSKNTEVVRSVFSSGERI